MKVICGKFHNTICKTSVVNSPRGSLRIGSSNPNKLQIQLYRPISTDGRVVFDGDTPHAIRSFLKNIKFLKHQRLIVLTNNERDLMLPHLLDFGITVDVFENKYPIFPDVKFRSSLKHNLAYLKKGITRITTMGITGGSLARYVSTTFQYKVERKIRKKLDIDKYFGFAYTGGYQEVFKFCEARPGRKIIAMDFNSMFLSCMQGDFPDPKNLRVTSINKFVTSLSKIEAGVYRVILEKPVTSFIQDFHWFKYVEEGKKRTFSINHEMSVETLILHSELKYLCKHFDSIFVVDAVTSEGSIGHPLFKVGKNIYRNRLSAKHNGDNVLEKYCKMTLSMLHSVTNPRRSQKVSFKTLKSLVNYLKKRFGIIFSDESEMYLVRSLNNMVGFSLRKKDYGLILEHPVFDNPNQIFSLSSTVLANSRVKILQTIEELTNFPSVEICYVNIDSIHISVDEKLVDDFIKHHKSMFSSEFGQLKMECIADAGYWFGVGRYWLFKDSNVVQFKNKIFNSSWVKTPFSFQRKIYRIIKNTTFKYIRPINLHIDKSLDYSKPISKFDSDLNINYRRYRFDEISNQTVAAESERKEAIASKALKVTVLNMIATDKVSAARREREPSAPPN